MKKIAALSLITTSIFCTAVFANSPSLIEELPHLKILNVFHVDEQTLSEFTLGQHPETILEFQENTIVPLAFFIQGDLLELADSPGNLSQFKVKKTFYTRIHEGRVLFSLDLKEWKEFANFFTGVPAFNITHNEGFPVVEFGLETNLPAQ